MKTHLPKVNLDQRKWHVIDANGAALGRLAVQAILQKDFPVVQGFVLFVAVAYVLANLVVDLCYAALDPRIRLR